MIYRLSLIISVSIRFMAVCWSEKAHRLIAEVALYNTEAADFLQDVSGTSDFDSLRQWMMGVSSWADTDEAKDPFFGDLQEYHYVHTTDSCEEYNFSRDCDGGVCIVTGIQKHISWLLNPSSDPYIRDQRRRSLQYLIHYLGDIHQPLHVAFRDDAGGNRIRDIAPYGGNLHAIWDSALLDTDMRNRHRNFRVYFKQLMQVLSRMSLRSETEDILKSVDFNNENDVVKWIASIASETSSQLTCKIAYPHAGKAKLESGDVLQDSYISAAGTAIFRQLQRAGVRLGKLLGHIAETHYANLEKARQAKEMKNQQRAAQAIEDARRLEEEARLKLENKDRDRVAKKANREIALAQIAKTKTTRAAKSATLLVAAPAIPLHGNAAASVGAVSKKEARAAKKASSTGTDENKPVANSKDLLSEPTIKNDNDQQKSSARTLTTMMSSIHRPKY